MSDGAEHRAIVRGNALEAENERLRAIIISLLEMPAVCNKDAEVIENVRRRKLAMDAIGAHRVLR